MSLSNTQTKEGLAIKETTELSIILKDALGWHQARTRFAAAFVLAVIKLRTVTFTSLALVLNPLVKPLSNLRRIQRFFSGFDLDQGAFARMLASLVPEQDEQTGILVSLDRTHWRVGKIEFNILMFAITHDGVAFPVVWMLLGKAGISNTSERRALLDRLLAVIPADRIRAVLADREFIGEGWFATLKTRGVPFVIRVRKNAHVTSRGCTKRAGTWIRSLPVGAVQRRRRRVRIYGHRLFLTSLKRESDDLFVVSDHPFEDALGVYGKRWGIETLFSSLKSRGFDLEATHVRDDERVQTRRVRPWLLALLALAFSFAFLVGAYLVDRQPILVKRHGRKAVSVFRMGLDHLRLTLLNGPYLRGEFSRCLRVLQPLQVLSCT